MREEHVTVGRESVFDTLEPFLSWNSGEDFTIAAEKLSITVRSVRVAVHRLRKRFGDIFEQEVAETIAPGEDLADEVQAVLHCLLQ
ncbi:MAG: helix-turn-helix domain-containing protein [Verrucomicrobiales bacterium]